MAFWSGEKVKQNGFLIEEFEEKRQDCNGYNLRVGDAYYCTSEDIVNTQKRVDVKDGESFIIAPGQFAFLITKETVNVPQNAIAFISMRTGIKFQGLINVSGFHVDPGYKGQIVYSVYNASPSNIQISAGDPLFKIWFADLDRTSGAEYLYKGAAPKTISNDLIRGMSREVFSLQGLSEKIRALDTDIKTRFATQQSTIDNLYFIYRTLVISTMLATVGLIFTFAKPTIEAFGVKTRDYILSFSQSSEQQSTGQKDTGSNPSSGDKRGATTQTTPP